MQHSEECFSIVQSSAVQRSAVKRSIVQRSTVKASVLQCTMGEETKQRETNWAGQWTDTTHISPGYFLSTVVCVTAQFVDQVEFTFASQSFLLV